MKPLDLMNDIVVFDIDGVLFRYWFSGYNKKVFDAEDWVKLNMSNDLYASAEKTELFDKLIEVKNPMDMYILSTAYTSFEQNNKTNAILENFGNIREDNIMFVGNDNFKVHVLQELRRLYDKGSKLSKRIVMIEDNPSIMSSIERLCNEKIRCFLISDFV